ncbi:glycosyltransferase family 4 protein [Caproiciproducens galactitolivorans]|uniref:Putative glycosyl transferase n=1 Tax=Caproiciproducens galactitolivorans TaxID=642589 RepID=A0A4Z0Y4D8_9FIRM|nr:glycosyltransferase family 4 protein [Caproiciproducens galactitolivorans]QEY34472.1 glycosyltransferase family 4 protein [Caproiciproducens galactitolivorans]TGJ77747.1 putative glycosyl transferase [Caproiciproducens galactitolivorans]
MNIIYINHYAGSTQHGMEFRPYFMAKRWAAAGHNVTIVASSYSHLRTKNPDMQGNDTMEQMLDGVRYFWIAGPEYHGNGVGRIKNMLSFLHGLYKYGDEIAAQGKPDAVIASSTYPLDIYPAHKLAKKYGAMLIYEVHDLWPLSPIELGGMSPYHPYIMVMQAAENYCYKHSDYVVSLLPNAKGHMVEHGLKPEKFICIPNGIIKADWEKPMANPPVYYDKLKKYHDEGYFLIGYTGAHGIANALDSFVEAGEMLREEKIKLLLIGPGPERERLIQKVKDRDLGETVELLEPVKRGQIPELLHQMDALYVGLQRQPLFRFGVSPNKLMDYMMAAKPVIFAIEAGNDMVADANCGISIPPEDSEAIAEAARKLASLSKEELSAMGERGKRYILENNEYDVLSQKFLDVFSMPY